MLPRIIAQNSCLFVMIKLKIIYCLLYFAVAKRVAKVPFIPGHECVGEVSVEMYMLY